MTASKLVTRFSALPVSCVLSTIQISPDVEADGGAYAEYIAVSTHMCIHKPHYLSWEEAAGIPEVGIESS
jgi:NADPH:quinone reductase-like Zn-dependent oxidoreductase